MTDPSVEAAFPTIKLVHANTGKDAASIKTKLKINLFFIFNYTNDYSL